VTKKQDWGLQDLLGSILNTGSEHSCCLYLPRLQVCNGSKIIVIAVVMKRRNKMAYFNKEENHQLDNIRVALRTWHLREPPDTLPPKTLWPNTRDIAECCDISIYIARYYLLKLVENNEVYVAPCSAKNILCWPDYQKSGKTR
jgi:hypothetical protein